MLEILPIIGSIITITLGITALISPVKIAQLVCVKPDGLTGIAEIRATYGGFFFGLGISALYLNSQIVFIAIGIAWLSAAFGRIVSMIGDRSTELKNIAGILFESMIGLLFIANV